MERIMTFYEAFEMALRAKGLKASDICTITGIHSSYFSKLKSGHMKDVTWEKALQIIDALGMTPDEFLEIQSGGTDE